MPDTKTVELSPGKRHGWVLKLILVIIIAAAIIFLARNPDVIRAPFDKLMNGITGQ